MGTTVLKLFENCLNFIKKPVSPKGDIVEDDVLERFFKDRKNNNKIKKKFNTAITAETAFDFNPKSLALIEEFREFLLKKDDVSGSDLKTWIQSVSEEFKGNYEKNGKPALLEFVDWLKIMR